MKRYKQWLTAGLALGVVGVAAGCSTAGSTTIPQGNNSGMTNLSQSASNSTNNVSQQTSVATNTAQNQAMGKSVQPQATKHSKTNISSTHTVNQNHFIPIIKKAMNQIHNAKFPLMAPTEPDYAPHLSSETHMGAQVQSTPNSYSVSLQWVNRSVPVNSPALSQPPNTGLAQVIGSYGGTEYASHQMALDHLVQSKKGDIAPVYVSPPKNAKVTIAYLGHGIEGQAYSGQYDSILEWHEGTWTLQVTGMSTQNNLQVAKQLVAYLNRNLLPETQGYFGVNNAGDGEHTSADWVYGNTVYTCSDYHYALQAAQMAVSMRVYPSGKLQP